MPTLYECDIDYYIDKFVTSKYGEKLEWFTIDIPKKRKTQKYIEVFLYLYNGKTIFDEGFDCIDTCTKLRITEKLSFKLKVTNTRRKIIKCFK